MHIQYPLAGGPVEDLAHMGARAVAAGMVPEEKKIMYWLLLSQDKAPRICVKARCRFVAVRSSWMPHKT